MESPIELVDAHFHLDLFANPMEIVEDIERYRIHTIAVTNAPSVFFNTLELCRERHFVHPAIGLHPELISSHGQEIDLMWTHLNKTRFIGEVGLDYVTNDNALRRKQREAFSAILARSAEMQNAIMTVHSRRSAADVISAVGEGFPGIVILHWFSGSLKELDRAVEIGCWFSANASMLQARNGKTLAARMPRDRVLTETDGPFLKVRGQGAKPLDVIEALKELAPIWGTSIEETSAIILENFRRAILSQSGIEQHKGSSGVDGRSFNL